MIKRYFRFLSFILADDEELSDFLPSRSANRMLETLLSSLRDVESVSKHLQGDGLTLLDARVLFDEHLKSHHRSRNILVRNIAYYVSFIVVLMFLLWISTDADIVHSALFEQALLYDQAVLLTDAEAAELEPFKRTQTCVEGMTLADKEGLEERLFSVARAVLRHERHRLSLMMLEMILFLKINSSYWDGATGEQCL
ncbi:hypothetical protein PR003_g16507 [Phytophthora rubi]|uniref:Uncharacterized protein n=1 Tax=Phytophthora rubi TaxID=129364 RepID=A0A6A4EMT5_9STRA|nr:hypothetical protein PR003_g16507 [Phytophthora rubi]